MDKEAGEEENKEIKQQGSQVGKFVATAAAALAGAFAFDKLFPKKKEEEESIEEEEGRDFPAYAVKAKPKENAGAFLTPAPKDYFPKSLESLENNDKELLGEALQRKKEGKILKALDILKDIENSENKTIKLSALILAGNCKYNLLQFNESMNYYSAAIDESKAAGDRPARATAYGNLGIALLQKYNLEKARRNSEESLKIYQELKDVAGEAEQLSNLAIIHRKSNELDKAHKLQDEALRLHKNAGDKLKEAEDLGNMGLILQQRGDVDKALGLFEQALKMQSEARNKAGEAEQLGNIGGALQQKGDIDSAKKYEEDSLRIYREIGNQNGEANQLGNIGLIYQQRGELDKALGYYGDAMRIHKQIGNRISEATGMVNIGMIYRKTNQPEKALEYFRDALKIFTVLEAKPQIDIIKQQIKKAQDTLIAKEKNIDKTD